MRCNTDYLVLISDSFVYELISYETLQPCLPPLLNIKCFVINELGVLINVHSSNKFTPEF
ncbi:hypothetical protein KUTeg_002163 [Tegillarca granosa]|uniref:Uncharacterized protein n=1 Tax=Tegillarca granosa TaxID=220873 RepID=A0ABQ9FWQ8_TEGGR|nr:hypothetical protein KUTeg_002163 [Tegillarca granosa]